MLKDSLNTILFTKRRNRILIEEHQTAPHERKIAEKKKKAG